MSSSFTGPDSSVLTPSSNLIQNGKILNPDKLPRPIIFLSGTTNYNRAEKRWQEMFVENLSPPININDKATPLTIIDPYNPAWDSTWREDPSDKRFVTQVNFELQGLKLADIIVVGFIGSDVRAGKIGAGGTALMELGMAVKRSEKEGAKVIVCMEKGFWKEGYVKVLCERFGVQLVDELMALGQAVAREVNIRDAQPPEGVPGFGIDEWDGV